MFIIKLDQYADHCSYVSCYDAQEDVIMSTSEIDNAQRFVSRAHAQAFIDRYEIRALSIDVDTETANHLASNILHTLESATFEKFYKTTFTDYVQDSALALTKEQILERIKKVFELN